jgi:hypothetical protein
VSERLSASRVAYMLTGSFALTHYATPRMTRDLDLVVALAEPQVPRLVEIFSPDFYVDAEAAAAAVRTRRMFNLMHLDTGIKVDLIVQKDSPYRRAEFERRRAVRLGHVETWIVSREDLILSKLEWARASNSELQRRDAAALLDGPLDETYLQTWAENLGVDDLLRGLKR